MYTIYIPFSPSNYQYIETSNNSLFYVKQIIDNPQEFTLYKNSADRHRVDKSNYLTAVGTISGIYRDDVSITNPVILLEVYKYN